MNNRGSTYLNVTVTPSEMKMIKEVMLRDGIESKSDFLREAINCYIGEDIFRKRDPSIQRDMWEKKFSKESENPEDFYGWDFNGGKVVINTYKNRIQIFFNDTPDVEMRFTLRMNHFTWNRYIQGWQKYLSRTAVLELRALDCFKSTQE